MTASALYVGSVAHQRYHPKPHRLKYRVFSTLIDLDELPLLNDRLRLFGYNRSRMFSLLDRDHGSGDGGNLKLFVREQLRRAGISDADGPTLLLCYPRFFGYVFNPLSTYYCCDRNNNIRALLYEVCNTHGERHCYLIPVDAYDKTIRQTCRKEFFVSPFMPMDCEYSFTVSPPGKRLSIAIRQTQGDLHLLDAWFSGQRQPLTDRNLLRAAMQLPLMTLKVIVGIHWEALKLWGKGLRIYPHQDPPTDRVTLVTRERT